MVMAPFFGNKWLQNQKPPHNETVFGCGMDTHCPAGFISPGHELVVSLGKGLDVVGGHGKFHGDRLQAGGGDH